MKHAVMRGMQQILIGVLLCGGATGAEGNELQAASLQATVERADSRVQFMVEGAATIIDVSSNFGIGRATIKRQAKKWPAQILVRLHLRGLESFKASCNEVAVEWSVSSNAEKANRVALWQGSREMEIQHGSPYFTAARVVGDPLQRGHFEIPLPAKLLEGNPQQISLQWIDFYRN